MPCEGCAFLTPGRAREFGIEGPVNFLDEARQWLGYEPVDDVYGA